jgi:hypothetical protein
MVVSFGTSNHHLIEFEGGEADSINEHNALYEAIRYSLKRAFEKYKVEIPTTTLNIFNLEIYKLFCGESANKFTIPLRSSTKLREIKGEVRRSRKKQIRENGTIG